MLIIGVCLTEKQQKCSSHGTSMNHKRDLFAKLENIGLTICFPFKLG